MKFLITLALAISIQASEVTWSEIDTRGSLRCVGQVTSSMPSICTSTVSVTMRTEVQCLDGTLKPAYKTLTSTQSGIYSSSTPGIYPTQVSSTQSGGIIEFEADVREGQNHEGSLEFTDSDAKVQCYEDGFVDPRDLIPAGTFENDSEYPTVGDNTQKELRFDNYSGGGWCEKGADSVISNGQNGEPETNKSFTCRDRDFETDREYILGTARYWIHSESEDPEDAVGDGYSELFPGGLINRQDFVGYRFSGASLHQRTTFSPIEGNPDITDYEENENDFRSKYSNQGRVEIVAKGLQDEQYTLKQGESRWYGLSFKLNEDDILETYELDGSVTEPYKRPYLKYRLEATAIIAQLHNATDKAAYFTLRKDPVDQGVYLSFAHDYNCPDDEVFNDNPCIPPFEIPEISDETIFAAHYKTQVFKAPAPDTYTDYKGAKFSKTNDKGVVTYHIVTSRIQRFNEKQINLNQWYHLRYKLTAQSHYHDGKATTSNDIIGRISAQFRQDSEAWQDFKIIDPKRINNTAYDLKDGVNCSDAGIYSEPYYEPLVAPYDQTTNNAFVARPCHTDETEAIVFTHSVGDANENLKNSFKFGWYGKTLTDEVISSSILIDNVSASPLKKGLKKPLREDPVMIYDFEKSPEELSSHNGSISLTPEDDGLLIGNLSSYNTFELNTPLQLDNYEAEELKVEIVLSIPASFHPTAQNYRGNIQLLNDYQWLGQFDLWIDRNYVKYNPSTDTFYYIAEFRIPNRFFRYSPAELKLVVNRMNGFDQFKIHSLSFYEMESYRNRNLNAQLNKLAEKFSVTQSDLLTSAKNYDYLDSQESQFNLWYRDLTDQDGQEKRFYFMIGQDVVYKMGGIYPWASLSGYQPLIPWEQSNFTPWRQIWTYLGNESL